MILDNLAISTSGRAPDPVVSRVLMYVNSQKDSGKRFSLYVDDHEYAIFEGGESMKINMRVNGSSVRIKIDGVESPKIYGHITDDVARMLFNAVHNTLRQKRPPIEDYIE